MTTQVLDTFCVLDDVREMKQADAHVSGLDLLDQWSVLDPALKRQRFENHFSGSLTNWSALDPQREVLEMNAALT